MEVQKHACPHKKIQVGKRRKLKFKSFLLEEKMQNSNYTNKCVNNNNKGRKKLAYVIQKWIHMAITIQKPHKFSSK